MGRLAARAAVVVVGVLVLFGLFVAATSSRQVAGYRLTDDGVVEQVALTCRSLSEGGGLGSVGEPTGAEVPQDLGLEVEPGLRCPEEGPVWQAALLIGAVVVLGATVWGVQAIGARDDDAGPARAEGAGGSSTGG